MVDANLYSLMINVNLDWLIVDVMNPTWMSMVDGLWSMSCGQCES